MSHLYAWTQALSKTQVVRFPLERRKFISSAKCVRAHDVLASMVLSAGGTAVGEADKNPCLYWCLCASGGKADNRQYPPVKDTIYKKVRAIK